MSPVVGVPKREPCQKCGYPVFLAERLSVGRALYHRTCLRCARCDSQLTLGSFYETETDGEFCCETCPDEEANGKQNEKSNNTGTSLDKDTVDDYQMQMDPTRKSFSEKLAMFQTNDKALLQKSLSDEEKSKSLQRLSELYARNGSSTIADETGAEITRPDVVTEKPTTFANDEDDDNESDSSSDAESENGEPSSTLDAQYEPIEELQAPPPIPTKPPPPPKTNVLNKIYGNAATPSPIKSLQRIVSTHEKDTHIHSATEVVNEMPKENRVEKLSSLASQTQPSIANSSSLVVNRDSEINASQSNAKNDFHALDESNAMPSNHHQNHHHQQETISNVTKDEKANCNGSTDVSEVVDKLTPNDSIITEIETNVVIVANERQLESAEVDSEAVESSDNRAAAIPDQIEKVTPASAEDERNATEQDDAITMIPSKPVPVKRVSIPTEPNDADVQPPTPMRRKHISNVVADEDFSLAVGDEENSIESKRVSTTPTPAEKPASNTSTIKSTKQYPIELNPFGDSDDGEDQGEVTTTKPTSSGRKSSKPDNSNPFDSSDDEIELLKDTLRKATDRKSSAIR